MAATTRPNPLFMAIRADVYEQVDARERIEGSGRP
jgi:hypothetical protein